MTASEEEPKRNRKMKTRKEDKTSKGPGCAPHVLLGENHQ